MKKHIICLYFLLIITLNNVKGQNLEQILEKHHEAVGVKNTPIYTIKYKGIFDNSYLKEFVLSKKLKKKDIHPKFTLSIINNQAYLLQIAGAFGKEIYSFVDGAYWKDMGGSLPEQWSPANIERLKIQQFIDISGILDDYKPTKYLLTKCDDVDIDNISYHRLRLVTLENDTLYYYLNPQTNLISKVSFFHDLAKVPNAPSYTITSYKKIKGIIIPTRWVYKTQMFKGPDSYQALKIKRIKTNPKLNKKDFQFKNQDQ